MDLRLRPPSPAVPGGLQRTSDERWLTLSDAREVASGRWHATIAEEPASVAIVLGHPAAGLRGTLEALLARPVPAAAGTRVIAPLDLLHDLDAEVVGWVVTGPEPRFEVTLATFLDPGRRAAVAPGSTWRHLLRAARNLAGLTAAVHDAGHAGALPAAGLRVDDRARVTLWRPEALVVDAGDADRLRDWRELARLQRRLLDAPATTGALAALLERCDATASRLPSPSEWTRALRAAESALVDCADDPLHAFDVLAPACPWCAAAADGVHAEPLVAAPAAPFPPSARAFAESPHPRGRSPNAPADRGVRHVGIRRTLPPAGAFAESPRRPGQPATRRAHDAASGRAGRSPRSRRPDAVMFALAAGVLAGAAASVAPFALLVALGVGIPLAAALRDQRRGRGGLARLVPYSAAGVVVAAFVFLDLALVFGLVLAVADRLFDYGPGFHLRFAFEVPQVPGLLRAFAAAFGALAGFAIGTDVYASLRARPNAPRMLATPMLAVATGVTLLAASAPLAWWPFELTQLAAR